MARTTDARRKAIDTAERLFCMQGYAATGLAQLIEESGSPKGSFYFHFPGGKRELALDVIAAYRARTAAGLRAAASATEGQPEKFVSVLVNQLAGEMAKSAWTKGCVGQVLAQELAPKDAEVADALQVLFDEWAQIIGQALGSRSTYMQRATALVAALEGARTLARACRSRAPFDAVIQQFGPRAGEERRVQLRPAALKRVEGTP